MRSVRTWVLIADGAHARILERLGREPDLKLLDHLTFEVELPPSRDLLAERPGRSFESQGRARHAKENPADPHRELKRDFAKKIAGVLEAESAKGLFDRLVVVAAPVTLGDLRDALPPSVRSKVTAELARDLVKTPDNKLLQHLKEVLPD
jgi:protein required for attachment to host cells